MICPSFKELQGFHRGKLEALALERVAEHLATCDSCQDSIAELDDSSDSFIASFRRPRTIQPFQPPSQIDSYRVVRELGSGGMGMVFLVEHMELGREFALKLILPHRLHDTISVQRFRREVKVLGKAKHPNIVQATDAGELNGMPWVVLEYVPGSNISQLLKSGPLNTAEACEIARQVAVGLDYIQSQEIIHRDIKPSNIMLTPEGVVKILDLGLARFKLELSLTFSDQMVGTLDYVSPEQIESAASVDASADIYSLGCTLFKMLTGTAPFPVTEYPSPQARMKAHCDISPPALEDKVPEVPQRLSDLLARMLAKDPSDRPVASEVIEELAPFTSRHLLAEIDLYASTAVGCESPTREKPSVVPPTRTRSLTVVIAIAFAILLASVAGITVVATALMTDMATVGESNSWRHLLRKAPDEVFWPGGDVSNWAHEQDDERLSIHCQDVGLLRLGATQSTDFELQVGMHQSRWHGGIGVAIAIRPEIGGDRPPRLRYQFISIAHHKPGGGQVAVERGTAVSWLHDGQRRFDTQRLATAMVDALSGEQLLEIVVAGGEVRRVLINGQEIPELVDQRYVPALPCNGDFGILSSLSSSVVRNARYRMTVPERAGNTH